MNSHFVLSEQWNEVPYSENRELYERLKDITPLDIDSDNSCIVEELDCLSFYPGACLIRIRSHQLTNDSLTPYWLSLKDGNFQRLDGNVYVIDAVNEMCPIQLNRENCLDYLQFVGFFVRSTSMPFVFLNEINRPLFGGTVDKAIQKYGDALFPSVAGTEPFADQLVAQISFMLCGSLYSAQFEIQTYTGRVKQLSVKEISDVRCEVYDPLLLAPLIEMDQNSQIFTTEKPVSQDFDYFKIQPQPALTVLQAITPADNESDAALIQAYSRLLQPISLQAVPSDFYAISNDLHTRYPWFQAITDRIISSLIVSAHGDLVIRMPPLLLVGAPGVGKTSYVLELTKALGLPIQIINVAGKSDARDLLGTARGYGTRQPGLVIRMMMHHGIGNGLCVLDELDKSATGQENGSILDALLTFLEVNSAKAVWDECLGASADCSYWNWIATANSIQSIPSSLLSRFLVLSVPNPKPADYPAIVTNTVKDFAKTRKIDQRLMPLLDEADWYWLRQSYQNPRKCRKATEWLLSHWLAKPKPGMHLQ